MPLNLSRCMALNQNRAARSELERLLALASEQQRPHCNLDFRARACAASRSYKLLTRL